MRTTSAIALAACFGLLGLAGTARATVIENPGGIPFWITVSNGVDLIVTGGAGTSANPWLVTENYTYNNLTPITLAWVWNNGAGGAEPADGNYFFLINEDIVNQSGATWSGYQWSIADNNGTPFVNASHPDAAHFHTGTLTQYTPFTVLNPQKTGGNGVPSITVSGGALTSGSTWYASLVKVHDYGNNPTKDGAKAGPTAFTVTETPMVPEPTTALMLGAAIALLGLGRRRLAGTGH